MGMTNWVHLPDKLRTATGGCWQERCFPFRGVFAEVRQSDTVERRRMLEDCWLALQEFDDYVQRSPSEQAETKKGE